MYDQHPSGHELPGALPHGGPWLWLVHAPPLRTTGSLLQYVIRDIQSNNFIKFNVHFESFMI